ncbi:DUF4136 domain-containing protein [Myxococcaceae bacterium GXIMD 01537]
MAHAHRPFLLLALLTLAACAGIETKTDYNPDAVGKLDGYRTYNWLPTPQGGDPRVYNSLTAQRVQAAVDQELQSRGYQKVDRDPNFRIGWHGAIDQKLDVQTVDLAYGYSWDPWYSPFYPGVAVGGAGVPETYVNEYEVGTLVLDIVDGPTNKLEWRGSAQAQLSENPSPEKSQKRIQEAVDKLLADFPPKGKK